MMKRYMLMCLAVMLLSSPVYAIDDDSTPYMPIPEQPQVASQSKRPARKTPARKPAPKKPAATKKPAPKKQAPAPAPKPSSLQQGIALINQGHYEAAKPYLLKAIQENRNDPNVWYWYGVYHEKTGGFYQAQYFYAKAVTIDPAFEPLSRVVYYPEDSEKTPLWDPKRPARVYEVETGSAGLPTVASSTSNFPAAPDDPELPHVPVYVPPEPGASPFDGDAWAPAVYVPPSPEEVQTEGEMSPVYVPPDPQSIIAQNSDTYRQVLNIPTYRYPEGTVTEQPQNQENIIRADKPLYTPPEPGQQVKPAPAPKAQAQPKKAPAPQSQRQTAQPKQQAVPRKVVRQSKKPAAPSRQTTRTQTPQPQRRQASPDVRPQTAQPAQPRTQQQAPQTTQPPRQQEPPRQPEPPQATQPEPRQQYMPPVGQYAPDPGTISESPAPPVGQGNQD